MFRSLIVAGASLHALIACVPLPGQETGKPAAQVSPSAVADSQAVLRTLDDRIKQNPKDADAWFRRGMVAWFLTNAGKAAKLDGVDPTLLGRMADTSLRIAAQLNPTNGLYNRKVGLYLLESGYASSRSAATGFFDRAIEGVRTSGNAHEIAESATEAGFSHWRRFEVFANRNMDPSGAAVTSVSDAMWAPRRLAEAQGLDPYTVPLLPLNHVYTNLDAALQALPPDLAGGGEYDQALALFREAYAAEPTLPRAHRGLSMALAERLQWRELATVSNKHLAAQPTSATAWMALGLAEYRLGNLANAERAFDSLLKNLDAKDRARFDQLSRVRPLKDTTALAKGSPVEQQMVRQLYWLLADPLWSTGSNEPRLEFLSRVAYSELRWSVEEFGLHGADSDQGNTYVRYGPPKRIALLGSNPGAFTAQITAFWFYKSGLLFAFTIAPTFGTARTAMEDRAIQASLNDDNPVRFDNIAIPEPDSMPSRIVRFRGGRDSVDLSLAVLPSGFKGDSSGGKRSRADVWLVAPSAEVRYRDSSSARGATAQKWHMRVAPGVYIARSEATGTDGVRPARTTNLVAADTSSFALHGQAISDLLLATNVTDNNGRARRWNELGATDVIDGVAKDASVTLVWENYEFGERDGMAQYDVSIGLTRERSAVGRVAARIVGGLAGAARISQSGDGMTIGFSRSVAHAPAVLDKIDLSLAGTGAGRYTVTITVTDRITRRIFTRTRSLTVGE